MKLTLDNEKLLYDIKSVVALFDGDKTDYELAIKSNNDEYFLSLLKGGEEVFSFNASGKLELKQAIHEALKNEGMKNSSRWGILYGVRPMKVVHALMQEGHMDSEIVDLLVSEYKFARDNAIFAVDIARREKDIISEKRDRLSIYASIPFCPSICTYCSFPTEDAARKGRLMEPYIEKLILEMEHSAELAKQKGVIVDNIYIGGGTPSVLDENLLEKLLRAVVNSFDMSLVDEFTFEAGRPDTMTEEKIMLLKEYGVTRICLNPQTMNDRTLGLIGRKHSSDSIRIWKGKLSETFDSVNMDLIAGLPGETFDDFKNTLDSISDMRPENITIHNLAIKSASELKNNRDKYKLPDSNELEMMIAYSKEKLKQSGYEPYYLYRQKNMVGNFENIGYSIPGHISVYNVRIMEEKHPILALGVGGVSKKIISEDHFERIPNFRSVEDYISRFGETLEKKNYFFQ